MWCCLAPIPLVLQWLHESFVVEALAGLLLVVAIVLWLEASHYSPEWLPQCAEFVPWLAPRWAARSPVVLWWSLAVRVAAPS